MRIGHALLFSIAASLGLSGCERRADVGAVVVSAIEFADGRPDTRGKSFLNRVRLGALAGGLVQFDAAGQVEPGLAGRWIVIDGGQSYIFRLREARWSDGRAVDARDVARALRRQMKTTADNPVAPFLTSVDEIVAMTPGVLEVRLSRPRPDLLKLFAQPGLAIVDPKTGAGAGPFRQGRSGVLTPVRDMDSEAADQPSPVPEDNVRLIGERAAAAILRFEERKSDLVLGGTIVDWPLLAQSRIAASNRRIDPAAGLFGLVVVDRDGFLGKIENRLAIARAIDRPGLTGSVSAEWSVAERLLPDQLDSAAAAAAPDWIDESADVRRATARRAVDAWRAPVTLRLALPDGPGGTMLWGGLAYALQQIGVRGIRVGIGADADLRLIDAVAPYDSARWYLATACAPCDPVATAAIEEARLAPTLAARGAAIARADAAMAADGGYIPIARPLRWSLVALRLRAWQPNTRAWHPLNHLRAAPN